MIYLIYPAVYTAGTIAKKRLQTLLQVIPQPPGGILFRDRQWAESVGNTNLLQHFNRFGAAFPGSSFKPFQSFALIFF